MRVNSVLSAGFVALIVGLSGTLPTATQREVIEQTASEKDAPASLTEQARAVDAIVKAAVTAREVRGVPAVASRSGEAPHHPLLNVPDVYTYYSVEVVDVLKARPDLPTVTQVLQKVGEMTWDNYLIKAGPGSPALVVGDKYVMFLRWSEVLGAFTVTPDGAYAIDGDRVLPKGSGRVARGQANRAMADFLAHIRNSVTDR